jgi:hypothetical protein
MNRNLKFAIAAAIASLGVTGQAHALTQSTTNVSVQNTGSLFLYVFEDRQANPAATNSAIFDLGLATSFDTTSNHSFDLSATTGWTSYVSGMNLANVHWGVFGAAGSGGTGSSLFSTFSVVPASIAGGALNTSITNYNAEIALYGSKAGLNTQTTNDLADSNAWDDNAGKLPATLTAGLGGSMDFFKYTSTGTKATSYATKTAFATGGDADYFTLDSTGHLSYVAAPVPEADSYAMMLAGLGLVGYMVRRRKAA